MKRHAILIGVSQFQEYSEMPCAANDLRGMAELLTSPDHGLFTDPIIFSHHPDDEIRRSINRVFRQASNADQILLYYSGHGEVDANGQLHLVTNNTEKEVLESSSIPTKFIRDLIDKSHCEKVMLILDCCFSGAIKEAFKSDVIESQLNLMAKGNGKGIYILTASAALEPAKQGAEYSILTHHILAGIREGEADGDNDGFVSMSDLFDYVKVRVPKDAPQTPTSHHYDVQGNKLFVARAHRVYSAGEIQAFKKKINELDNEDALPDDIIKQAREIISANQQKRDKALFDLLHGLCEKNLGLWPFQQMWMAQIGQSSSPSTPATSEPKPSPPPQKTKPALKVEAKPDRIVLTKSLTENLNGAPLEMTLVPAGEFLMGSTEEQVKQALANAKKEYKDAKLEWFSREMPQHKVTLAPFYMGKYQITQGQWKAVMGEELKPDFKGNDLPMESISWEDAQVFCQKISALTSKEYRLPSEAEWEYACRAGTKGDYAGNLDEMAWRGKNSDSKTHPVGQKKPNAFGLYDMHGNVWEWCQDWYGKYESASQADPTGPQDGQYRVLRGGSWINFVNFCRSAYRYYFDPGDRFVIIGFRVVVGARTP